MLSDQFVYSSIAQTRALGGGFSTITDSAVYDKIREASAEINRVTEQWFQPVGVAARTSGRGDSMIHFPDLAPLIRVESLALVYNGDSDFLENFFIERSRRVIRLKGPSESWLTYPYYDYWESREFPKRAGNVLITGFFGWIDSLPETDIKNNVVPVETTTTQDLLNTSTSLTLDSVSSIQAGSCLLLGDDTLRLKPIFVVSVDRVLGSIAFDALGDYLAETIPSGAKVRVFGAVPRMIRRAAGILAAGYISDLVDAAAGGSGGPSLPSGWSRKVIMEKTEDYQYRLSSSVSGDTSGSILTTGNEEVDSILRNFSAPVGGIDFV